PGAELDLGEAAGARVAADDQVRAVEEAAAVGVDDLVAAGDHAVVAVAHQDQRDAGGAADVAGDSGHVVGDGARTSATLKAADRQPAEHGAGDEADEARGAERGGEADAD